MAEEKEQPVVVVLCDPSEYPWPGLDSLNQEAKIVQVAEADELKKELPEADVLVVTDFRSHAVEEAWGSAKNLKWVHATSAGVDPILFPAFVKSDIPLTNAQGIFSRPIGEYVLGLILAYAKDFWTTYSLQQKKQWKHRDSERVKNKKVLVVGTGSVGTEIGKLTKAAGLKTYGIAREARDSDPVFEAVYASDDFLSVLGGMDYVVIAAPLTSSTRGMFGKEAFEKMNPAARFINIGRGPIVQTDALVTALQGGEIAGAALDVFETEPLPSDHPLWTMDNVFVSPHMAGDVKGWRDALSEQFVENYQRWRNGETLFNQVDKSLGYVPA